MHHITDLKTISKDIAKGLKALKERIEQPFQFELQDQDAGQEFGLHSPP